MAVDTTRLRFGDMIAGGSAVLLFLFTFLKWFKASGPGGDNNVPDALKDLVTFNAWEAMPFFTFLLLLCVVAVIAVVVIRATGTQVNLPVPLGTIILAAGALAVLIILFRLLLTPDPSISFLGQDFHVKDNGGEVSRSYGIFLGLLAAIGMLAGGFLSAKERGEAIPGVGGAGLGTGGPAGGPLGGGQPAAGGYGGQPAGGQPGGGYGGQPAGGQPVGGTPATAAQPAAAQPAAAAQPSAGNPPADWYDDPRGEARLRYWDGQQWTDQTAQ